MNSDLPEKMIVACRIMDGLGLTEGFGQVSARSGDWVVMTPGRPPGKLNADMLLTFNLEGERIDGAGPADLETPLHLAIYRTRPDVGAICRTHSRYAGVMGAANQRIEVAHGLGGMLGRYVPIHPEIDLVVDDLM